MFGAEPSRMGPTGCPKSSLENYHYSLCNNPKEPSSQLLHSGNLKPGIVHSLSSSNWVLSIYLLWLLSLFWTLHNLIPSRTIVFIYVANGFHILISHGVTSILDLPAAGICRNQTRSGINGITCYHSYIKNSSSTDQKLSFEGGKTDRHATKSQSYNSFRK